MSVIGRLIRWWNRQTETPPTETILVARDEYVTNHLGQPCSTTDGQPPRPGHEYYGAPSPIDPQTGQHKSYWVLSAEERAKGFIRPVRNSYVHVVCGSLTRMGAALSETYARDPKFYGGTFCCHCGKHFPLSINGVPQFTWDKDGEVVGS